MLLCGGSYKWYYRWSFQTIIPPDTCECACGSYHANRSTFESVLFTLSPSLLIVSPPSSHYFLPSYYLSLSPLPLTLSPPSSSQLGQEGCPQQGTDCLLHCQDFEEGRWPRGLLPWRVFPGQLPEGSGPGWVWSGYGPNILMWLSMICDVNTIIYQCYIFRDLWTKNALFLLPRKPLCMDAQYVSMSQWVW